jgi:hypothetical protein
MEDNRAQSKDPIWPVMPALQLAQVGEQRGDLETV